MPDFKPTGNEDTDAVLDEMAKEGLEVPDFAKPDKDPDAEEDHLEDEPDEDGSDDETQSEEEEDGEEEEDFEPPTRSSVPRQKYEHEQKKRREAEENAAKAAQEIEKLKRTRSFQEIDEEIRKFAEDEKIPLETAKKIIDLAARRANNPELEEKVNQLIESRKEEEYWNRQEGLFNDEFRRTIIPLVRRDNPNATQTDVDAAYDRLSGLAWSGKNAVQSLVSLYLARPQSRNRVTGEPSRVRSISSRGGFKDLNDMTPEEIDEMSDEEFDQYSEALGKHSPKLEK